MGEARRRAQVAVSASTPAVGVETPKGRIQVRWDGKSAATPFGQMAFFLEFLHLTGVYERWQASCPLRYSGPHGSRCEDILGTWFLSLLAGHRRYAHMNAIRFDGVMPDLLGMQRAVAEDTVRRFLKVIARCQCTDLYIVTPFVVVQDRLRERIRRSGLLDNWVENPSRWPYERIGTVHTVQGREAEAVILALGAPLARQTGARGWAGGRPNLLNVAVSRAQEVLYVVGNRDLWKKAGVFSELNDRI